MNKTLDLLLSHMSIRKFTEDPVGEEIVRKIIQAAQWAATTSHYQAYTIIRVADPEKRRTIAQAAGDQKWVMECPLFLVFCADLHRGKKMWTGTDPAIFSSPESFLIATVDAVLAAQKAFIAAQSLGLGGVFIGGIRNDIKKVDQVLGLPELVLPLFGICLGYPAESPGQKPRLPLEAVYKIDSYHETEDEALVSSYDQEIKAYYDQRSAGKIQDTWTERCGRTLMSKPRDDVGILIKEKGFTLG